MDTNPSLEEFVTHSEGFGECVFFSLLGRDYLLSCGSDGDIRVVDLSGEKEPTDLFIGSAQLYQLACVSGELESDSATGQLYYSLLVPRAHTRRPIRLRRQLALLAGLYSRGFLSAQEQASHQVRLYSGRDNSCTKLFLDSLQRCTVWLLTEPASGSQRGLLTLLSSFFQQQPS